MEEKDVNQVPTEKQEQGTGNESNAARRIRLLGIENDDKIHDESVSIKKGSFWENLWYQYKWGIIIGVVLLITAVVFIVSVVTQPEYDMYVAYAGPLYTDGETKHAIDYAFGEMLEDYNGDGEKLFNFAGITYQNEEQRKQTAEEMKENYGIIQSTDANYKALDTIRSQMMSGVVAIYLMDEELFRENGVMMMDLTSIVDGISPDAMVNNNGVYFKKTDFYRYMSQTEKGAALKNLPNDTVLCILPKLTTMDKELHESSITLISDILKFEIE